MSRPVNEVGRFLQRSFDHLVVKGRKRDSKAPVPPRVQSAPTFVHAKDRIPLWNISHGDRVRVNTGDHKGKYGTVDWVDRAKNRVYLTEAEFCRAKPVPTLKKHSIFNDPSFRPDQTILSPIPIHYSNVSLVMQRSPEAEVQAQAEHQAAGRTDPLPELVAKRLRATGVHYDPRSRRWVWKRLAENAVQVDSSSGHSHAIDLPREARFTPFVRQVPPLPRRPNSNDTPSNVAMEETFVPSLDPTLDLPPELQMRDMEFFAKYGRAKRTQRYNQRKALEAEQKLQSRSKGRKGATPKQHSPSPATSSAPRSANFLEG